MEELQRNNESQLSDRTSAAETEDSEVVVASPSSRPQSAVLNMVCCQVDRIMIFKSLICVFC